MNNDNDNDYSQGKVYKVWSPNHSLCYYGSTVQPLAVRMNEHRSTGNNCTSKQIIDAGDADIALVQDYPCMNKHELEDREAELMQADWDGCVNELVPGAVRRAGGRKEYYRVYNEKNVVKISERQKEWKEKNAVELTAYHKKYYEKNAEKMNAYNKERYEQEGKKYQCECGGKYTHQHKARHFRSKKHKDHVEEEVASVICVLESE